MNTTATAMAQRETLRNRRDYPILYHQAMQLFLDSSARYRDELTRLIAMQPICVLMNRDGLIIESKIDWRPGAKDRAAMLNYVISIIRDECFKDL